MPLAGQAGKSKHMFNAMKVLIQHPKSLEYWSVMNRWTDQLAEAADFQFALNAIRYGIDLGNPFLVAFRFEQPAMDFTSHAFASGVPARAGGDHPVQGTPVSRGTGSATTREIADVPRRAAA